MNSRRLLGIVFTSIGLLIAVLTSIGLAVQPETLTSNTQAILVPAIIAFVVVFALMVIGLYFVVTTNQTPYVQPEMEIPLLLVDKLRGRGQMKIQDLAYELTLTPLEIETALQEITLLKIFNGYINEERGIIGALEPNLIAAVTQCAVCSTPIRIQNQLTACKTCSTQYYTT